MPLVASGNMGLDVRADADDVRTASEWLHRICSEHGVPDEQVFRLDLCLNEALANIIYHGTSSAREAPVRLSLQLSSGSGHRLAELEVSDTGRAFNPLTTTSKATPRTLDEATPGGVGLAMLRCYSDQLGYAFHDGRNHLTFGVRWDVAG